MAKGAQLMVVRIFASLMVPFLAMEIGSNQEQRAIAKLEIVREDRGATTHQNEEDEADNPSQQADEKVASSEELTWLSDYAAAVRAAKQRRSMLLLWFQDPAQTAKNDRFHREVLQAPVVREQLANFVLAQIPVTAPQRSPARETSAEARETIDSTIHIQNEDSDSHGSEATRMASSPASTPPPRRLLEHGAFSELDGEPGLAILDLTDETSPHFHHVVSVFPLQSRSLSVEQTVALLKLPLGSLTQRTLIWAVWTHPENPRSADGQPHEILEQEAESHSHHQAVIRVQGHHRWGSRFQRLMGRLPTGLVAQEVCAESWPGQRLIDAAEECVRSWRHSTGHWDAVRRPHPVFGYDMKRGSNGIWYATGVFGRRQ